MEKLPNKELLRPDEVAEYFQVTRKTIYHWVNINILPAVKIRTRLRFRREDVKSMVVEVD